MKTLQSTEISVSWGDPFDEDDIKSMNKDLKSMFGNEVELIIDQQDDSFTIKIIKEDES